MLKKQDRNKIRVKRHARLRNKISGTAEMPRLNVRKSNQNIYAQIIDDVAGRTLVSASTMDKGVECKHGGNIEAAKLIGDLLAKKAVEKGITNVVFDRSGYVYHGRVKELADAARAGGLKF